MASSTPDHFIENMEKLSSFENPEEASALKQAVEKLVVSILENVKSKDERFQCTLLPAGSTYDNLKIGLPDEYDYMAVLDVLSEEDRTTLRRTAPENDGSVNVVFERNTCSTTRQGKWSAFIENGLLNTELLSKHFRKLANSALVEITKPERLLVSQLNVGETNPWGPVLREVLGSGYGNKFTPYSEMHGPAVTLFLMWQGEKYKDLNLTVDITLAIHFDKESVPIPMGKYPEVINLVLDGMGFHVVPVEGDIWRITFQQTEREFLNLMTHLDKEFFGVRGLKYLKTVLEKQLNLPEGLLPSYFLKTIFLHRLSKQIDEEIQPSQQVDEIAKEMLSDLLHALETRRHHSFFLPQHNLLGKNLDHENDLRILLVTDMLRSVQSGKIICSEEEAHNKTFQVIALQSIDLVEFYTLSIMSGERSPVFWSKVFGNIIKIPLRNRWSSFWNQMTALWKDEMDYEEYIVLVRAWPLIMEVHDKLKQNPQGDADAVKVTQKFFEMLKRKKEKNKHHISHASRSQIQPFSAEQFVLEHICDFIDSAMQDEQLLTFLHKGIPREWKSGLFLGDVLNTVKTVGPRHAISKLKNRLKNCFKLIPPNELMNLPLELVAQIISIAKETMKLAFKEPIIDGMELD